MRIIPFEEIVEEVYHSDARIFKNITWTSFLKTMKALNFKVVSELIRRVPIFIGEHAIGHKYHPDFRLMLSSFIFRRANRNTLERSTHSQPKTHLKRVYAYLKANYPYKFAEYLIHMRGQSVMTRQTKFKRERIGTTISEYYQPEDIFN